MAIYTILLIDTNSAQTKQTGELLRKNGYSITSVSDNVTAQNTIKVKNFNVIIIDLTNPGANASELIEYVKKLTEEIYMLLIGDAKSLGVMLPSIRLHYDDYLCKPYFPEELLFRVQSLTEKIKQHRQHKRQDAILVENIEHFRTLFNHTSDYILVLDTEQEKGPILINANETACRSYGYTREEFIGLPYTAIDPNGSVKNFESILKNLKKNNRLVIEMDHVRKDGSVIPVEVSAILVNTNGIPLIYLIESDLSKRRRIEEEQMNVTKLESIGILAGGFAHDFNNLFSIIYGNIELAKYSAQYDEDPVINLKKAENAIMQAQSLTQLLSSYSKGSVLSIEKASVKKLIQESITFLPSPSGIIVESVIPDNIGFADMDITQMKRALGNIILNAIESMPDGGSVKITADNIDVTSEVDKKVMEVGLSRGQYVKILVTDEGSGIPREYLPLIFDPYFSTKERGTQKGMGMGLAISYSIIKRHLGLLTNQPGNEKGTTFMIIIPRINKECMV